MKISYKTNIKPLNAGEYLARELKTWKKDESLPKAEIILSPKIDLLKVLKLYANK